MAPPFLTGGSVTRPPEKPSAKETAHGSSLGRIPVRLYLRVSAIWLTLGRYRWVLLLILAIAWYLRARIPHYSSAFMDEAAYILYGRMFLTHHFEAPIDQPLQFSFGWYLWPAIAAIADRVGGLIAVREMAALLGVVTVLAVYGFARRLFSPAVGAASAMVFALLGPAVFASRIATRDTGTICFFALGLWLFVRAWQREDSLAWLASAAFFLAAFLCKYLIALYFPFLVVLSFWKGRRPLLYFTLPLVLFSGLYGYRYANDLAALLRYGASYTALRAPPHQAWQIYFTERLDFWVLAGLSLVSLIREKKGILRLSLLLWVGTAILSLFQWFSRADYDYWKHVNYSLLFLTPLAMQELLLFFRGRTTLMGRLTGAGTVALLAVSLGWAGNSWHMDRFLFWPDAEPIAAFFEGRLVPQNRVLVDDSALRYYLDPPLQQSQIADPFYLRYREVVGEPAYAAAVRDGLFDYIALDGGVSEDARRMRTAIQRELLARYRLSLSMPEPLLGQPIEIYTRIAPPPATPIATGTRVEILSPAGQSVVQAQNEVTTMEGVVRGAEPGWYVRVDVFTNRWYPQGGKVFLHSEEGSFSQRISLGGQGKQRCHHLVRARLFDGHNRVLAVAVNFGIARAHPDGNPPACR